MVKHLNLRSDPQMNDQPERRPIPLPGLRREHTTKLTFIKPAPLFNFAQSVALATFILTALGQVGFLGWQIGRIDDRIAHVETDISRVIVYLKIWEPNPGPLAQEGPR